MTRQKTGVTGDMLVEIDPARLPTPQPARLKPSKELAAIVSEIGAQPLHRLMRCLATDLAGSATEDRPRAIELIGAIHALLEAAGAGLEDYVRPVPHTPGADRAAETKQPGPATGLY